MVEVRRVALSLFAFRYGSCGLVSSSWVRYGSLGFVSLGFVALGGVS
jgi:hypothetical protein